MAEQVMDAFTQRRFELMVEMSTKKLQQEITALKEYVSSLNNEIGSLKSQVSRLAFQPQHAHSVQTTLADSQPEVKEVKIMDCRPENEKHGEFQSGAAKNSEPVRPRYGNYNPQDVSIDKFFYFGRK